LLRAGFQLSVASLVFNSLVTLSLPAYAENTIQNVKVIIYTVIIVGTTFSGHPTRTTFGNSLRVILYLDFIAADAGYTGLFSGTCKELVLYVSGDDVMVKGTLEALEVIKNFIPKYYAANIKKQSYGLG